MKRTFQTIVAGLVLGLWVTSCSDRTLEDEELPPDIEGLCYEHCVRVMECVWTPELGAEFDTVAGCQHNCEAAKNWDECPRASEAVFACTTQYDCPYYARVGTEHPDGPCVAEVGAFSVCNPE
jgi:hypothetical protein